MVLSLFPKKSEFADQCEIDRTYFSKWLGGTATLGSKKLDNVIRVLKSRSA